MRLLVMWALLLLVLPLNCAAIAPVQIGGEHGQEALSMIADNQFRHNTQNSSDLWTWGGSPTGYGQLFPGQGASSDFGSWAPDGETPLGYTLNETPSGFTINETKRVFSVQGQSRNTENWSTDGVNPTNDAQNEPTRLFPSQGFFNGYGVWEPLI